MIVAIDTDRQKALADMIDAHPADMMPVKLLSELYEESGYEELGRGLALSAHLGRYPRKTKLGVFYWATCKLHNFVEFYGKKRKNDMYGGNYRELNWIAPQEAIWKLDKVHGYYTYAGGRYEKAFEAHIYLATKWSRLTEDQLKSLWSLPSAV